VKRNLNVFFFILGENQEQLRINFTRSENIQKLTCRTRNTIGQSEASVNVDILCKKSKNLISNKKFICFFFGIIRSTKIVND
jgi:hypothetical protein